MYRLGKLRYTHEREYVQLALFDPNSIFKIYAVCQCVGLSRITIRLRFLFDLVVLSE